MRVIAPSWSCQLLHADSSDRGVLLDLVALDPCPFPGVDLPVGTPFVIRVVNDHAESCGPLVQDWADTAAVVDIRIVETSSGRWLCVSGKDQRHLLLEVC